MKLLPFLKKFNRMKKVSKLTNYGFRSEIVMEFKPHAIPSNRSQSQSVAQGRIDQKFLNLLKSGVRFKRNKSYKGCKLIRVGGLQTVTGIALKLIKTKV